MPEPDALTGGPPRRQTGRQRAARIPLDYYKGRDGLGRLRLGLVLLAPVAALGWWFGSGALRGGRSDVLASHGPIWAGHAMWENDCETCHVPFQPIRSDSALAVLEPSRLAGADARCASCHNGPVHHAEQLDAKVESCGSCHRDHRGREADLNRVPDQSCTVCHADLPEGSTGDAAEHPHYLDVRRFDRDHPEFAVRAFSPDGLGPIIGRLSEDDPDVHDPSRGRFEFSHALHLTPGLESAFTFKKLKPEDRARYGLRDRDDPAKQVALDCRACHVLDGGDSIAASTGLADQSWGGNHPRRLSETTMLPISYQAHCIACHPISIPGDGPERPPIELPHGVQPGELRTILDRTFAQEALDDDPTLLDQPAGSPGPSGTDLDEEAARRLVDALRRLLEAAPPPGSEAVPETRGNVLQDRLRTSEAILFQGVQTCAKCHVYDRPEGADVSSWKVVEPGIPEVWFSHALFSHTAHRAVDCNECHGDARASTTNIDILMPSIENCRSCHAPSRPPSGNLGRLGGARFDCVECHRYHNGDRPLQGIGALARQVSPEDRRTIEAFIRGGSSDASPPTETPGGAR